MNPYFNKEALQFLENKMLPNMIFLLQSLSTAGNCDSSTGLSNKMVITSVVCLCQSLMSDFATPWTVAYQAPLSRGFSRQEYWSGLPFPFPITSVRTNNYFAGTGALNFPTDALLRCCVFNIFLKLNNHSNVLELLAASRNSLRFSFMMQKPILTFLLNQGVFSQQFY